MHPLPREPQTLPYRCRFLVQHCEELPEAAARGVFLGLLRAVHLQKELAWLVLQDAGKTQKDSKHDSIVKFLSPTRASIGSFNFLVQEGGKNGCSNQVDVLPLQI